MKKLKKLTPRQEQFCRNYIIDLNATQAAIRAGYSPKTANRIASENLSKLDIQERISELKYTSLNRVNNELELELKADTVLKEMAFIAMFRPEKFVGIDPKTGKLRILIDKDNIHELRGIVGLKIKERSPIKVIEMGIEIERDVIEIEFKTDKARALEALMKHFGILKEKTEVAGMNDLVKALQAGRDRVARLNEEREAQKR